MSAARIRAVQVCRRRVAGLDDDETWRDFLEATTAKRSLRAMTGAELGRVLDELHRRGAPRPSPGSGRGRISAKPHARKIFALWAALEALDALDNPTSAGLRAFVKRMTGADDPDWLDGHQARTVIEGLRAMCGRAGFEPPVTAGDAAEAKRALARAIWRRLHERGAVRIADVAALDAWLHGRVSEHKTVLSLLGEAQLDRAIAKLGGWLRQAKSESAVVSPQSSVPQAPRTDDR